MADANLLNIFNRYNKKIAKFAGQQYDVVRPVYGSSDNIGTEVHSNKDFFVDVSDKSYSEPAIAGAFYYDVYGDRSLLQVGDILKLSTPDTFTCPATIISLSPFKACVGLMTERLGEIHDSLGTVIHSNVLFHIIGHRPGSSLDPEIQASLKVPDMKAIVYYRSDIVPKMRLVQTDQNRNYRWIINSMQQMNNLLVLTLTDDEE